ncbi:uncharacterized protein [Acropora muricata]|uniref:uncharacterized protein n=1 Tax=Acropora muricata TaxID=159855 RepID=UPI001CF386BD|nr:uncharacterized protein LOC114956002 isoform X2 [Acropora millepora]
MESKGKLNFLWMILVVLFLYLIIDIIPRTSANKRSATRNRLRKQECKDNVQTHDTCVKLVNELGLQVCHTKIKQIEAKLTRSCPATCGLCGRSQPNCRRNRRGCCWDTHTTPADIYGIKGCPECKDHLATCRRFRKFCFGKETENKSFIKLHCPLTCGRCKRRRNVSRLKVRMSDWLRI